MPFTTKTMTRGTVFNSKTSCSPSAQPPLTRMGSRMKLP